MARLALATGIGPSDLLAAPPSVFAALLEEVAERERAARMEQLKDKTRGMIGR